MLRLVSQNNRIPVSRREWLRLGGLGSLCAGLGLSTATSAHGESETEVVSRPPGFGTAKSVILVFTSGGQSQIDTWDPKPDAPLEVRGEYQPIDSKTPGVSLCEHLPRLAKLTDRFTILRSMSHEDLDHGSAVYLSMTGHYHTRKSSNPPPRATDYPVHGGILKRVRPESPFVQPAVHLNGPAIIAPNNLAPGQYGGFLGREYDALTVGDVTSGPVVIPGLTPQQELPLVRMQRRQRLVESLDQQVQAWEQHRQTRDLNTLYDQAFELLANPKTRGAFDLSQEPNELRDRYGRNRAGQSCLLARRLVEAGVPLVTVMWNHHSRGQDHEPKLGDFYGWDTHNDIFSSLTDYLLPRFDLSFSALLEDLENRGMLEDTLVLCFGEFGRAPKVALEPNFKGATPGRKHWAAVYSIVAAGAGVGRGQVVGRSDRFGAYPVTESYAPWDLSATIFSALGIDPASHYPDLNDRPYKISEGRPITSLYTG